MMSTDIEQATQSLDSPRETVFAIAYSVMGVPILAEHGVIREGIPHLLVVLVMTAVVVIVSRRRLRGAHRLVLDSTTASAPGSSPNSTPATEDQP